MRSIGRDLICGRKPEVSSIPALTSGRFEQVRPHDTPDNLNVVLPRGERLAHGKKAVLPTGSSGEWLYERITQARPLQPSLVSVV
jgi:hypothetical protein